MNSKAPPKDPSNVRFGRALRHARNSVGWTQKKLAKALECSDSHVSNVESGARPMALVDVQNADKALQCKGRLQRLHRELHEPAGLDWLDRLTDLQAESELIRESHPSLIPGLLQTKGYAEAIIAASAPFFTPEQVQRRVEEKADRSRRVLGPDTPHYHVVIDETALTRPVGQRGIMKDQVASLLAQAESGRVLIQVHPFEAWPYHGLDGPFMLLSSASAPDVVHVESVRGGHPADDPPVVRRFVHRFGALQASAWSPKQTMGYLRRRLEEYEHDE